MTALSRRNPLVGTAAAANLAAAPLPTQSVGVQGRTSNSGPTKSLAEASGRTLTTAQKAFAPLWVPVLTHYDDAPMPGLNRERIKDHLRHLTPFVRQ